MSGARIDDWWQWLTYAGSTPPVALALAALASGALLTAPSASWARTRLLATYVHEAGHALVALCFGRRVAAMRLHADTSGSTDHAGPASGLGRFATAFGGYPAPAVAAAGLASAAMAGHARVGIAVAILLVALLSFVQASWRGWLVTFVVLGGGLLLAQSSPLALALALLGVAGYLWAATPRTVVDLHRARARHREEGLGAHSDADTLAGLTGVPPVAWEAVFLVVSAACAYWIARAALAGG